MRDINRQRVYRAEKRVVQGKIFETVPEVQTYVNRIVMSAWWKKRTVISTVIVKDGRRRRRGSGGRMRLEDGELVGFIKMPKWTRYETYVLHELAHVIDTENRHGRGFVLAYLGLVERFMCPEVAQQLKREMAKENVTISKNIC